MPVNRIMDFAHWVNDELDLVRRRPGIDPLYLGGSNGPNGGTGSPPGGFIGRLLQRFVTYDETEAATSSSGSNPSLVDNLNHIRQRLFVLESGSGLGGGGGHLHGIQRWSSYAGQTIYDLVDIAEMIEHVTRDGIEIDPALYTLSDERTQLILDVPSSGSQVVVSHCVILSNF